MSFFRQLVEEFKRPVVASESLDARPAPISREPAEHTAASAPAAAGEQTPKRAELRNGC